MVAIEKTNIVELVNKCLKYYLINNNMPQLWYKLKPILHTIKYNETTKQLLKEIKCKEIARQHLFLTDITFVDNINIDKKHIAKFVIKLNDFVVLLSARKYCDANKLYVDYLAYPKNTKLSEIASLLPIQLVNDITLYEYYNKKISDAKNYL